MFQTTNQLVLNVFNPRSSQEAAVLGMGFMCCSRNHQPSQPAILHHPQKTGYTRYQTPSEGGVIVALGLPHEDNDNLIIINSIPLIHHFLWLIVHN